MHNGCASTTGRAAELSIRYQRDFPPTPIPPLCLIDNGSTDRTRDHLLAQADCIVFYTDESYRASNFAPEWINRVIVELPIAAGRWWPMQASLCAIRVWKAKAFKPCWRDARYRAPMLFTASWWICTRVAD
jgi:hypothetical protein